MGGALGATFQRVPASGLVAASIVSVAASWWGRHMNRLMSIGDERRLAWAAGLTVGPSVVLVGIFLSVVEPRFVAQGAEVGLPIHVVYLLLFVPAVLLIAAIGGFALGLGARNVGLGASLAATAGLSAALAFLVIALLMDMLGWRVGAPNAGRRATMLVVTALGATGAALVSGAMIGHRLSERSAQTSPEPAA